MTRKELYHLWLQTDEWREISDRVKKKAGYICQRCDDKSPYLICHHLTYQWGWKPPFDIGLVCWCSDCHNFVEGRSPYDPLKGLEAFDEYLRAKFCNPDK